MSEADYLPARDAKQTLDLAIESAESQALRYGRRQDVWEVTCRKVAVVIVETKISTKRRPLDSSDE